jgi:hypothetical protein
MQNATHLLEVVFETSVLLALLFSLGFWMGGRKPTNGQMLSLFAFFFAICLLTRILLTSTLSIYPFLIGYVMLKLFPSLKRVFKPRTLLNSKTLFKSK